MTGVGGAELTPDDGGVGVGAPQETGAHPLFVIRAGSSRLSGENKPQETMLVAGEVV